jgi:hypothetical protein
MKTSSPATRSGRTRQRETGFEPATSSLGIQTYVGSKSLARFCCDFLNLQRLAESVFSRFDRQLRHKRDKCFTQKFEIAGFAICRVGRHATARGSVRDDGSAGIRNAGNAWRVLRITGIISRCAYVQGTRTEKRQARNSNQPCFLPVLYRPRRARLNAALVRQDRPAVESCMSWGARESLRFMFFEIGRFLS